MKQGKIIFENEFLSQVISQWKRPQLVLFQVHCELTPSFSQTKYQSFVIFSSTLFHGISRLKGKLTN